MFEPGKKKNKTLKSRKMLEYGNEKQTFDLLKSRRKLKPGKRKHTIDLSAGCSHKAMAKLRNTSRKF